MRWNLRRSTTRRTLVLFLGCLFLALAAYQRWGDNGYWALERRRQEQREWETRNQELRGHNAELGKRIHDLKTDPKTIEKIAREELMLVRPEDKVILAPQRTEPRP